MGWLPELPGFGLGWWLGSFQQGGGDKVWCVAGFCGAVEFFGWLMIKLKNGMQLRHVWTLLLVLCLWCVAWFGLCVDWIVWRSPCGGKAGTA